MTVLEAFRAVYGLERLKQGRAVQGIYVGYQDDYGDENGRIAPTIHIGSRMLVWKMGSNLRDFGWFNVDAYEFGVFVGPNVMNLPAEDLRDCFTDRYRLFVSGMEGWELVK